MKKTLLLFLLFVSVFAVQEASAVVITPTLRGAILEISNSSGSTFDLTTDESTVFNADVLGFEFDARAFFEYDISGLSSAGDSSVIRLNITEMFDPYPFDLDFYAYTGDGALTLADFSAGSLFATTSYGGESFVDLDVKTPLTNFIGINADFLGIAVRKPVAVTEFDPDSGVSFHSIFSNGPETTQDLTIKSSQPNPGGNSTAVPEPATMALMGLGLAVAGLRKRFKK